MAALRSGDPAALDELFRRHYADLCRTALRFLGDEAHSEDVVQEFFAHLWEKRENLPAELTAVPSYLRRSVRNRSLNALRDRGRIPVTDGEIPETVAAPDATSELETSELRRRIHRAIDQLPERCRLVFVMSKLEDMSNREIADQLEITPKTVENQMTRAYKFLRGWLSVFTLPVAAFLAGIMS